MSNFKQYRRTSISEMRPVHIDETATILEYAGISISKEDLAAGSPKPGDMIARNPKNHNDMWLVAKEYFNDNLEAIDKPEGTYMDRLLIERDELNDKLAKLTVALVQKKVPAIAIDILTKQQIVMDEYLSILNKRIG